MTDICVQVVFTEKQKTTAHPNPIIPNNLPSSYPHIRVFREENAYVVINCKYLRSLPNLLNLKMNLERAELAISAKTLGHASSSYEAGLTASIVGEERAQSLCQSAPADPLPTIPDQPNIALSSNNTPDPAQDRRKKFRRGWAELKKKIQTNSDSDLICQAKNDILELLEHTQVAYKDTVHMLDLNWDLLGVGLLPAFFEPLLIKAADPRLSTKDGLLGVLWGLKNGKLRGDSVKVTEMAEISSMVSADLKLCSSEVRTFRESQDIAEKQWGTQSALISKYISRLETMSKELILKMEEPKPKSHSSPKDQPAQTRRHQDGFVMTVLNDCIIRVTHPEEGRVKKIDKILAQIRQLYGSKTLPFNKLTSISPSHVVDVFKTNVKLYEKDVAKAMMATYSDLDPSHKS